MKGTTTPRVKICCISTKYEAQLAIASGASALGLVGQMPSGPGVISDLQIEKIAQATPPAVATFLLTSETSAANIITHHQQVNTTTIQMVDALKEGSYDEIRTALPMVKLVQVIHVLDETSVEAALHIATKVDAILLDSGNPNLEVKELGGTGRVHNWEWSKTIREEVEIPVFLAGGLNPDNIRKAIAYVQPFGLDLRSGVRTSGQLDPKKLHAFFSAIKSF